VNFVPVGWLFAYLLLLAASARAAEPLVVGVLPYQGARALIAEHNVLAAHLRATLKRPVRIVTARNAQVFGQRLLAGKYHLALAPAHLARLAQRDAGGHLLAGHLPETPVYLLAPRQPSAGPRMAEVRVAVPDSGLLVTLVAQRWFDRQDQPARLVDAGSHAAALQAVLDGRADYAASPLAAMNLVRPTQLEQLRIAHEIGSIPLLVYVGRHDLAPADRARIQAALLKFPVSAPLRVVTAREIDLAAMDPYLPATRLLLAESKERTNAR